MEKIFGSFFEHPTCLIVSIKKEKGKKEKGKKEKRKNIKKYTNT